MDESVTSPARRIEWPQTAEVIRGRANVIGLNRNHPQSWTISVRRLTSCGAIEAGAVQPPAARAQWAEGMPVPAGLSV